MNYSETYFELDSEEATHCHHCHLISCLYIKGLVNTKDQSNACMCEMMSKGSKEALTVLIDTHVTHVKRVERLHYVHNIDTFNAMSKGSKDYVMLKQRTYTFLLITFLIFKRFSIQKKFKKAKTQTFPTIPSNAMYVEACQRGQKSK